MEEMDRVDPLTQKEVTVPLSNLDFIRILIRAFTSYDEYRYAGEISRLISLELSIYISPEVIDKTASKMKEIKRMWTENGWRYTKMRTLDYWTRKAELSPSFLSNEVLAIMQSN